MLNSFEKDTIALLCSALRNRAVPIASDYSVQGLFVLAKEHRVLNMALYGLLSTGVDQANPLVQQIFMGAAREVIVHENQMSTLREVLDALEQNGIDHLPLKGVCLKPLYPKPEMRTMSDADILIREEQYPRLREVLLALGFEEKDESNHEHIWRKGMLTLELHKRLVPSYDTDYAAYFGDGWQRAIPGARPHEFVLSDEDAFVYIFTHFAKHYRDGGIGISHLTDLWVYRKQKSALRTDAVEEELEKLGLLTFYRHVMHTLEVWFDGADAGEIDELITRTVLSSGAYGTRQDHLRSAALREKSARGTPEKAARLTMLRRMLFPNYKEMCQRYAFVRGRKWLLPFSWPVLWMDALLRKRKSIARRKADLRATSAEQIAAHEDNLRKVGLSFDLKR